MHIKVSVFASTFNRAALLDKALATYSQQTMRRDEWEYVLVDDGSTDNTERIVMEWQRAGLPIRYIRSADIGLHKEPGKWRDGSVPRNAASMHCIGEVIVGTHPEIMIPPNALELAYESATKDRLAFCTAIPYWMPAGSNVDAVNWTPDRLAKLRTVPGFYEGIDWRKVDPKSICYANEWQERRTTWESEVWWAMDMRLWRSIGGFREFEVWGSVDVDFSNRRRILGIRSSIIKSPRSEAPSGALMVYHQWHDEGKRDMDKCMQALPTYTSITEARKAGALYSQYFTGPREREAPNEHRILGDHIDRYRFAAMFANRESRVLDVPCGTGYGSDAFTESRRPAVARYVGVDIDHESVGAARDKLHRAGWKVDSLVTGEAYQEDMVCLDSVFPAESFDLIACLEGIEHIREQANTIAGMLWLLAPGGRLVISTPQKGVAAGTAWDRYMLTQEEFSKLLDNAEGVCVSVRRITDNFTVEWYHQRSYGGVPGTNPVIKGVPGPADQIMIAVVTRNATPTPAQSSEPLPF